MRFGDLETVENVKRQFPIDLKLETLNNYDPSDNKNIFDRMLSAFV